MQPDEDAMPQPDLFGHTAQRRRPRVLMHAIDAGSFPDGKDAAQFACRRCNHNSGWIYASRSEARRGIPCPICNHVD